MGNRGVNINPLYNLSCKLILCISDFTAMIANGNVRFFLTTYGTKEYGQNILSISIEESIDTAALAARLT